MRIAGTVQDSIVDGKGLRFTVFTQGCPRRCEGCHNPGALDTDGGREVQVRELIREMLSNPLTDGLTLSGGEPFLQPGECAEIAEAARAHGQNVWAYTGYTFEELMRLSAASADIRRLIEAVDVLVDGPFELARRSLALKWRGSENQRVLDMGRSLACGAAVRLEV